MIRDYGTYLKGGVITQLDSDFTTIRLRMPAGILNAEKMKGIAAIAEEFGNGEVHLTTRQTVEIPHVDHKSIDVISKALDDNGTPIGAEREEIVNITACPGIERCKYGNIDTIHLAMRLDEAVFGRSMPVKLRIAVAGCPYACTSPVLNEIGIVGRILPRRIEGKCTGCGTCVEYCKEKAIFIQNGIAVLDHDKCVQCGLCIRSCPYGTIEQANLNYYITVGGGRGRHPKMGREFVEVYTEDDCVAVVEKIVYWIYRRAWSGRLLAHQLDEIEFDAFRDEVRASLKKEE